MGHRAAMRGRRSVSGGCAWVVVGVLRCWRAVMSRWSGVVSCTADGGCERATTGMVWSREARDATERARVVRGAVQQEQGERVLVGFIREAGRGLTTSDKRVCLSSSSLAVAGLALCPSALTCCCCCCPSPSPPALHLPRDVRRQLTFDRLLGARIIFELLAIVAAAAAAAGCCCPLPLSWGIETDSAQEGYMRVGYARCRRGVCFLCRVCNQNVSCRALCRCR